MQVQKVPFGVDPKTVLCIFFKQGNCEKGKKCKFSHDPAVERKGEKKNLYQDTREAEEEAKKKDGIEDWDEEKLRQVVMSKHGNPKMTTDKVCKFFVDAVENGKYGWFWSCPNGGDKCMYKHSLPPGYAFPHLPSPLPFQPIPQKERLHPLPRSRSRSARLYASHSLTNPNPQLCAQNKRTTRRGESPHG